MRCITAHNVNQALAEGLRHIQHFGVEQPSRNGPVWVSSMPVITTYKDPQARTLFSPLRNANPFFHVMEALWMLAGRNDLAWPKLFNKNFDKYSDDGLTLHGAYGHRWRNHFGVDQIAMVIEELSRNPHSRRAVIGMWDPSAEWAAMAFGDARDVPCNDVIFFDMIDGRLNMTVACRSNDLWWGAYGANAVHFSFLQEYVAAGVGAPMGVYRQFSNNFHLYPENLPKLREDFKETLEILADDIRHSDRYTASAAVAGVDRPQWAREKPAEDAPERVALVGPTARAPLVEVGYGLTVFGKDLELFLDEPEGKNYAMPFFNGVARPMYAAWMAYKAKDYFLAEELAGQIKAADWRIASVEWLERMHAKRNVKAVA